MEKVARANKMLSILPGPMFHNNVDIKRRSIETFFVINFGILFAIEINTILKFLSL